MYVLGLLLAIMFPFLYYVATKSDRERIVAGTIIVVLGAILYFTIPAGLFYEYIGVCKDNSNDGVYLFECESDYARFIGSGYFDYMEYILNYMFMLFFVPIIPWVYIVKVGISNVKILLSQSWHGRKTRVYLILNIMATTLICLFAFSPIFLQIFNLVK